MNEQEIENFMFEALKYLRGQNPKITGVDFNLHTSTVNDRFYGFLHHGATCTGFDEATGLKMAITEIGPPKYKKHWGTLEVGND